MQSVRTQAMKWNEDMIGYLAIHISGHRAYGVTKEDAIRNLKMKLMQRLMDRAAAMLDT